MSGAVSNKLVTGIARRVAQFWTLGAALIYGIMTATDDVWHWLNGVIHIPPETGEWLSTVGAWLAQFGGWLLLVIWALGVAFVLLLALLARRIVHLIPKLQRDGGLS